MYYSIIIVAINLIAISIIFVLLKKFLASILQQIKTNNELNGQLILEKDEKLVTKIEKTENENYDKLKDALHSFKTDLIKNQSEFNLELNKTLNNISEKISKQLGTNNEKAIEKYGELEKRIIQSLLDNNKDFTENVTKLNEKVKTNFEKLINNVERNLTKINEKVEERLSKGFEKTNKTFTNIIERLSKIDEAQKKIDSLSTNIVSLQSILSDKKSRGEFGEIWLSTILIAAFGEKNDKIYKMQYTLSNRKKVDSILFLPEPIGKLCIDAKFPMENYKKMINNTLPTSEREISEKQFKRDVRTHIDAISDKYIIENETANQAILFLPAEAVFAEINAYHRNLIEYSQKKSVWLCSPTTLMSVLSTIQMVLKNLEREKYAKVIQEELNKLSTEFGRYRTRWDKLSRHIDNVSTDVKEIHTTTGKISNRFDSIAKVEFEEKEKDIIEITDKSH